MAFGLDDAKQFAEDHKDEGEELIRRKVEGNQSQQDQAANQQPNGSTQPQDQEKEFPDIA